MELTLLLKALGDPTRLQIFQALLEQQHCVRSLSITVGITESAVSQHLKILRRADLVYSERRGHYVHYFPKQEAMDCLAAAFTDMRDLSLSLDRGTSTSHCEFRRSRHETPT